jgi:hypothetical protein
MQVALLMGIDCPTSSAVDTHGKRQGDGEDVEKLGFTGRMGSISKLGTGSRDGKCQTIPPNAKRFCLMPNDLISGGVHCII